MLSACMYVIKTKTSPKKKKNEKETTFIFVY